MSKLLLAEADLETVLRSIGNLAVAVIPSCEEAGVTLEVDGHMTMRTSTGEIAERVDAYQYEIEEGPCVSARETHRPVLIARMESSVRWPRFSAFAAAQGVKSSYAIPMTIEMQMIGVLNLYSINDPFGDEDELVGVKFAEQAAMAVRHADTFAKTRELIENLHRALETRDTIGAAVGILMHRDSTTMDGAITLLKEISQRENLKLREVAEQILSRFET